MGYFTPEREAALEWIGWFCDNNISRKVQNEIAEAYPDMVERWEYVQTLSKGGRDTARALKEMVDG